MEQAIANVYALMEETGGFVQQRRRRQQYHLPAVQPAELARGHHPRRLPDQ